MTKKLRLNLQHFAEGEDDPADNNNAGQVGSDDPNQKDDQQGEKTFTQDEVNQMMKERVAREKKNKEEAVKEAERLAKMNKDQKAEYEREQMQKELESYKAKEARYDMMKQAGSMLKEKEINANDELLEIVTADTAEQTKENVEAFTNLVNETVKAQVQAKLSQGTPKNYSTGTTGVTRESIMQIKDDSQRQRAIAENINLFN
ncbi:DUF4355 domain-containing protein [Staphylococcus succinus]